MTAKGQDDNAFAVNAVTTYTLNVMRSQLTDEQIREIIRKSIAESAGAIWR